jgi:hypothetical protein
MIPRIGLLAGFAFLMTLPASGPSLAQVCPRDPIDTAELTAKVTQAARQFEQYHPDHPDHSGPPVDAAIIYRSAAIGGQALIPALRRIAKPGMPPDTVPGAAQVSLAKLGDRASLDQIKQEFESGTGAGFPAQ